MTVQPNRSQYRQTADLIRSAIERGEYARGSLLPREDELAATLGVDRSTVNRALRILAAEGLVQPTRGKGTSVSKIPAIPRNAVARYSQEARERAGGRGAFDGEIKALNMTPRSELHVERVSPPPEVAEVLAPSDGALTVVLRGRRMYADDVPVQLADSYIPLDIATECGLEATDTGPGGMLSRMAEHGYAQTRISERVTVRPPTAAEASFLDLREDQRVYAITHTGWTAEGRPVEVCVHVMPTHLWTLDYEWPTDG